MKLERRLLVLVAASELPLLSASSEARRLQGSALVLEIVGNNGDFDAPYPLEECKGDCDNDEDCLGAMVCLQRDDEEAVPGCRGEAEDTLDYCVQGPPTTPTPGPTLAPGVGLAVLVGNPPDRPLNHCEGDCDDDDDCAAGDDLVCVQRDDNDRVNGCCFDDDTALEDDWDLCVSKRFTRAPTLSPTMAPTTAWPTPAPPPRPVLARFVGNPADNLGRCEGDCDSDADCRGDDLVCHDRDDDDDAPGCYFDPGAGGLSRDDDDDVCVDRANLVGTKRRLRLYWEEGYYWQEDSDEQDFCLQTDGDELVVKACSSSSRQKFEFVYLVSGEALIRADRDGRCLSRRRLRDCDANDEDQRWFPYNGRWQETKFELGLQSDEGECLSPHHHPRDGEIVYMLDCKEERRYTTNAWEFY